MRVKEESKKDGLKLNIKKKKRNKTKILASGPITSLQIEEERVDALTNFIFLGSQITVDGDYSHEIKRHLLLGRKVTTNLENMLKSRDITLPTKQHIRQSSYHTGKAMIYPAIKYRCERWTIKKAEQQRIDAFKLWCWRRLLGIPWTARRSRHLS